MKATSTWTQDSDTDFDSGDLVNLNVVESLSEAKLELDLKSKNEWTDKTRNPHPTERYGSAMASIYGTNDILLFGGHDKSNRLNDTWIYNTSSNNWKKLSLGRKPFSRESHAMAAIYGTNKVVLFGGFLISLFVTKPTHQPLIVLVLPRPS